MAGIAGFGIPGLETLLALLYIFLHFLSSCVHKQTWCFCCWSRSWWHTWHRRTLHSVWQLTSTCPVSMIKHSRHTSTHFSAFTASDTHRCRLFTVTTVLPGVHMF